jgi:hypothetical protein
VSITPIPRPIKSSPGTNVSTPEVSLTSASNSPIATCERNVTRQLIAVVIRPPISGPAAAPTPAMPLITPKARARERRSSKNRGRQDVDRRDHQRSHAQQEERDRGLHTVQCSCRCPR